jgi:hypothetical protein
MNLRDLQRLVLQGLGTDAESAATLSKYTIPRLLLDACEAAVPPQDPSHLAQFLIDSRLEFERLSADSHACSMEGESATPAQLGVLQHGGVKAGYLSKLQRERESHLSEIRHHTRRIQEEASELARLESEYIDWEDPKAGEHPLLLGAHPK